MNKQEIRCVVENLSDDLIGPMLMQEHVVRLKKVDGSDLLVSLAFDSYKSTNYKKDGYQFYFTLSYARPTLGIPDYNGTYEPFYWGSESSGHSEFFGADTFSSEELVNLLNANKVTTQFPFPSTPICWMTFYLG
jgi:hypothetical protein